MRKRTILYIFVLIIGVFSCSKSEVDNPENDLNELKPGDDSLYQDTIGIHPLLGEKYLTISRKEQRLLYYAALENIYTYRAIALPEADYIDLTSLPDSITESFMDCDQNNYFYGYPSAAEANGNIIVIGERRESEKFVNSKSDNFMLLKNEEDKWEQTDFFKFAPYGFEFMGSTPMIGKSSTGKIVMKGKGLLVSDGDFSDWKHYPHAFDSILDKKYVDHGPVFSNSSKFGMFFGTGQYIDKVTKNYGALIAIDPDLGTAREVIEKWVPQIQRTDGSYRDIAELHTPTFYSVEHSDLTGHVGDIIGFAIFQDKVYQFIYNYKTGDTFDSIRFTYAVTTITGSLNRHSPVSVEYNPLTKKFEMIHSSPYYLEIYSIDPEDLLTCKLNKYDKAEWNKEALILDREVSVRGQGMYPVSSIIDISKGVQKIYIFAGDEYPARAGIFEITRTLDTDALSSFVEKRRNILAAQLF